MNNLRPWSISMLYAVGFLTIMASFLLHYSDTVIGAMRVSGLLIIWIVVLYEIFTHKEIIPKPELTMWNMPMNSTHKFGDYLITRVPDGWIYRLNDSDPGILVNKH